VGDGDGDKVGDGDGEGVGAGCGVCPNKWAITGNDRKTTTPKAADIFGKLDDDIPNYYSSARSFVYGPGEQ